MAEAADADELVEQHLSLIRPIAEWVWRSNLYVEVGDLITDGYHGLCAAARGYDKERTNGSFSTYATYRIRGAMIDGLRRYDPVPRSFRRRVREVQAAADRFAAREGRTASTWDTAAELRCSVREVTEVQAHSDRISLLQLDEPLRYGQGGAEEPATLLDLIRDPTVDIERQMIERELAARLQPALTRLNAQQRFVVALYYWEDWTQREIAELLGVTESRISQILAAALRLLRDIVPADVAIAA